MTQMGQRFYETTMPRIARALEQIADNNKEKPPEEFTCKCGYGGFESMTQTFIKCMQCGRVYR
jgi:hypothetical protein